MIANLFLLTLLIFFFKKTLYFELTCIFKTSSRTEDCPSLVYFSVGLFLVDVKLKLFPINNGNGKQNKREIKALSVCIGSP